MTTAETATALKRTPFYDIHVALGGKMVPFAGYEMPVSYAAGGGIVEHNAVRQRAGLFDVSHMGEFLVTGPQALDFVAHVTSNDVKGLAVGQVHYSTILNERGTIEDDCLVYRFADGHAMMVVNASNAPKDFAHIKREISKFDAKLEDVSDATALLALQGPNAATILQTLTKSDLSAIGYYHFTEGQVAGMNSIISRTGYTGEDGFELYFGAADGPKMWNAVVAAGDVTPCGLGARDTLRLEMGMALYGNDIDDTVTPLEANLAWLVKLAKGDFVGKPALVAQKEKGVPRKLVGFTLPEKNIARHGFPVFHEGVQSGTVCSGTLSPSVGTPIGTCYLPTAAAKAGTTFEIDIRGKRVTATVVKTPFYQHGTHL